MKRVLLSLLKSSFMFVMDAELASMLTGGIAANTQGSSQLTTTMDRNLVQGLGVVNTNLIQQHGGTTDDAATMAALRTARYVPVKNDQDNS